MNRKTEWWMEGYTYSEQAQGCAKYCKPEDFGRKTKTILFSEGCSLEITYPVGNPIFR